MSILFSRRDFPIRLATLFSGLSAAGAAFGYATLPRPAAADEISHNNDAIHQEVEFKTTPKRVYEALTDPKQFEKVVQLSSAAKSGMVPAGGKPAEISSQAGGAFSLFGGYITGRHVELIPNQRIIQAWRAGSWPDGIFSIARFELSGAETTKLVFDHTSFPNDAAAHLAEGWHINYWEPLAKFLG